ncbi:hypothetical protein WH47_02924 [Habropoda laboriosa]|uniref:Uncharacterized protein n=1 Tax=Habropoda laboriosa TaxID=597456 RepID=A0A0L7QY40_9HYME|nr:hypothetical protein WH47_02924 [Habropoda laboriosa]
MMVESYGITALRRASNVFCILKLLFKHKIIKGLNTYQTYHSQFSLIISINDPTKLLLSCSLNSTTLG